MGKKYKVTAIHPSLTVTKEHDEQYDVLAWGLKEKYGLPHTIREIVALWSKHSDSLCASWLIGEDKEEIEAVFGVSLEEIID